MSRHAGARWRLSVALLCASLAACGGGGGDEGGSPNPDPGVAGAPYFPLTASARWRYTADGQTTTARVVERTTTAGEEVVRLSTEEPSETTDEYFVVTSSGVDVLPPPNADTFERAVGRYTRIRFPLRTGETTVLVDRNLGNLFDFDADGRLDPLTVRSEQTVLGFERVVGAHATFDNALHLRTVFTQSTTLSRDNRRIVVTSTAEEWYAPGVGLVRSIITYSDGSASEHMDLREWSVGTQRSDNTAPAAVAQSPLAGALTRSAAVSLTLSEAVEAETVTQPALTVIGPDGNAVAGTVSTSDHVTFRFIPAQTLANGSYTVRVAGSPADWFGNTVAPVSWTFTLDATGPTLVAANPADGSIDIGTQPTIALQFNEALDPATAAGNVTLAGPSSTVPATLSVSGNTVTLTPNAPLQKGVVHRLSFGTGLTDTAGNPMALTSELRFTTDPGRFALPTNLPGLWTARVSRTAMADLDNDGRADLVAAVAPDIYSGEVRILRATGAGAYAQTPTMVPQACQGWPLVIETNGDGRPDLVQSSLCGVQHWLQNADGSWAYQGLIAAAGQYQLLTLSLPLAGSTRPGLVMIGGSRVELRRPAPGGGFLAPETLHAGLAYPVVGDVNGDGRADIVLADSSGLNPALVLLLQQPDASFVPQSRTMLTLREVLLATDINGDGRTDLVVSDGEQAALLLQGTDGSLGAPVTLQSRARPIVAKAADMNGDGLLDLVLLHSDPATANGFTLVTQGSGGSWNSANPIEWEAQATLSQGAGLELGDFNADGRVDILYGSVLLAQRGGAASGSRAVTPRRARLGMPGWGSGSLDATSVQSRSLGASQLGSMP